MSLTTQQQLAELGYAVFPCVPGGKRPLIKHGLLEATTDAEQIERWSEQWPSANWAIRTDGLLVVDVDGGDNDWFASLGDKARELAAAHVSLTPRGGRHFIFRQPDGANYRNTQSLIAHKVDTRANGGYILVPPSAVDGRAYRWATGDIDVGPCGLPLPPNWILEALEQSNRRDCEGSLPRADAPLPANVIPEGVRNKTLFSLGFGMRRAGMSAESILAALQQENAKRCRPPLDDAEVAQIADSCSRYEADWRKVFAREHHAEQSAKEGNNNDRPTDPGKFPPHLLKVPGFIADVMEFNLATAYRKQPELALAGALCLLSALTGRKIADKYRSRTNIYCLGICPTGGGKDQARDLNKLILNEAGVIDTYYGAEGLKSDAALIAELEHYPAKLFQIDEIDQLLVSMADPQGPAHHRNIGRTLMTLYTSSHTIFFGDGYADRDKNNKKLNQPHAVLFGTTGPSTLYASLTKQTLINGFISRMLIFEVNDDLPPLQFAPETPVPRKIIDAVCAWHEFNPGGGTVVRNSPPLIVEYSDEAEQAMRAADDVFTQETRGASEERRALWTRALQKARKLALLWACSESQAAPLVRIDAAHWACELVYFLTRKMIYAASDWVTESPYESKRQAVLRKIRAKPGIEHSALLRAMRSIKARDLDEIIENLTITGDVRAEMIDTGGRPKRVYYAA